MAAPRRAPKARAVPRQKKTPSKKLKSLNSMFLLKTLVGFDSLFFGFETANIPTLFVERGPDDVAVELALPVHFENTLFFILFPIH
jgi:hypothetical protein